MGKGAKLHCHFLALLTAIPRLEEALKLRVLGTAAHQYVHVFHHHLPEFWLSAMHCDCPAIFVNVIIQTVNCVKCDRCWALAWFHLDDVNMLFRRHTVILSSTNLILAINHIDKIYPQ